MINTPLKEAILLLGSNLGNVLQNLNSAKQGISDSIGLISRESSIYRTAPWGVTNQPEMYALQAEIERICQRLGLQPDPRKFTPHVTLARLRSSRVEDVVEYLSGRGNFMTPPFTVSRFVLLSSRDSVGGGPYLTEEVFPLHEVRSPSLTSNDEHPASSIW